MLNKYESIFIIDTEIGEDNVNALIEKFKTLLETSTQLENVDVWGKRRLAYPINYKTDGYYVLMNFSAEPTFPKELERVYKITDNILKYLIIKKER